MIESSDILIHTGPEFYEVSTIILEGMLLGKPVIDVYLDKEIKNLKSLESGILRISVNDDFTKIKKIIVDETLSLKITEGINQQLPKYISNQNNSSKEFIKFLDNIKN